MSDDKEVFLPDTNIKFGVLKQKLSDVYGLHVISKKDLYIWAGIIVSVAVIYQYVKK